MPLSKEKSLYYIIASELNDELTKGEYRPSGRLPKVRDLSERYNCSVYTIHKALRLLKEEGKIRTTQGGSIEATPEGADHKGLILLIFPNWDSLEDESFASQFVFGATLAASKYGYQIEAVPFNEDFSWRKLKRRLKRNDFQGALCANPAANLELLTAQMEALDIKVVATHRHNPFLEIPYTHDDFDHGFANLADRLVNMNIQSMGIFSGRASDSTYAPALQTLIKCLNKKGITIPENGIFNLNMNPGGVFNSFALNDFWHCTKDVQAYWSFTPNMLEKAWRHYHQSAFADNKKIWGSMSIRTWRISNSDLILESNVAEHAKNAFTMLNNWIESNTKPVNKSIPCKLIKC